MSPPVTECPRAGGREGGDRDGLGAAESLRATAGFHRGARGKLAVGLRFPGAAAGGCGR